MAWRLTGLEVLRTTEPECPVKAQHWPEWGRRVTEERGENFRHTETPYPQEHFRAGQLPRGSHTTRDIDLRPAPRAPSSSSARSLPRPSTSSLACAPAPAGYRVAPDTKGPPINSGKSDHFGTWHPRHLPRLCRQHQVRHHPHPLPRSYRSNPPLSRPSTSACSSSPAAYRQPRHRPTRRG